MLKLTGILFFLTLFSIDLSAQWFLVPSAPTVYIRSITNSNNILYLPTAGNGVYRSTDDGNSWQQINNGLNSQQSKDTYELLDWNGSLYVATTDGIYKSSDNGGNWVKKSNGITIGPGAIYEFTESIFEYNENLFTGAWNGIYRSANGGENWLLTNISGFGVMAKNFTEHNGILFAARETNNTPYGYKSTDNGITWQDLTEINFPSITFYSEPPLLWMGAIDGVWLSTDDGLTWENRNNGLNPDPYSSSIIRVNGVLVTSLKFGGSDMFRSFNNGLNWEHINEGLPFINSIEKLIPYNGKILAATSEGLYQRDISEVPVELTSFTAVQSGSDIILRWSTGTEKNNKGFEIERSKKLTFNEVSLKNGSNNKSQNEWESVGFVEGNGTTTQSNTYSFTDKYLLPGEYRYRLRQTDFDGSYEYSPVVEVIMNQPADYRLSQNYPNPFNPSTRLTYLISQTEFVSLRIYDVLGTEIRTLVNEVKPAGEHTISFDGAELSSGIYYYTLKTDSFTETKKMLLMK